MIKHTYLNRLKDFYTGQETENMARENHKSHNSNPEYWNLLLGDIKKNPDEWNGKKALDFGCGCGRNIENLLNLSSWQRVDGCDISETNVEYTKKYLADLGFTGDRTKGYTIDGENLSEIPDDEYDFVMSTIVFQHINSYDVRFNLMKEIFRVLKPGGLFSFQMGIKKESKITYFNNGYDALGPVNVIVDNPSLLLEDMKKAGFRDRKYKLGVSFGDSTFDNWIFAKGVKK